MDQINSCRHSKQALRRLVKRTILSLSPDLRTTFENDLHARFPELPGYGHATTVLLYVTAFAEEISTRLCLLHALNAGKRLLCPRVDRAGNRLRLFQIGSLEADLAPGMLGIPEPRPGCPEVDPAEVDWALVPGLAFDPGGYRLGRGAGLYDRLLPALRPDAPCWALSFECQILASLPVEPHDVPIDGVQTPMRMIRRHA